MTEQPTTGATVTVTAEHFDYLLRMARFGADHARSAKHVRHRHLDTIVETARMTPAAGNHAGEPK